MKGLKLYLLLNLILLAVVIDGKAAESVRVTVPEIVRPEAGGSKTSQKASTGTISVESLPEQTGSVETQSGVAIGLNFTGSTLGLESSFVPPDTMGAVGPNHIVELINGRYSVYRKSDGLRIQTSSLDQFWRNAGVSFNGFTFDPRILYDPFSQRWFTSSADNASSDNHFLIAVSKSPDPTAGWNGFAIDSDSTNLRSADFPTLGFNRDGIYLSATMQPIPGRGVSGARTTIIAIPKNDLLTATPTVANATKFENLAQTEAGLFAQPIVDLDNTGLPASLISSPFSFTTSFKRSEIIGSITSPTLDTTDGFIFVTPFSARFSAEQPGPKQNLDIMTGTIFQSSIVKQNGAFWGVQNVDFTGRAALRWFQIDADTNQLLQEGLIADTELDFYYGSIAVNKFDDVVIGFNGSGESQFVSSYAVAGKTVSGITTFGNPLRLKPGVSSYQVGISNRWGDYSATVIDPADPYTFWTFQEFVSSEDIWSTQITQFSVGQPELVNNFISFIPNTSTFETNSDTSGCPTGFLGKFSFNARLADDSTSPSLSHLMVTVTTLSNGNLLENADFGPGGVGATLTVPRAGNFSDGLLSPGESVDVPFSICLKNTEPFSFFVDVLGIQADLSNSLVLR